MAIRKIDFYVGALFSYLINKKITPAIIENSDDSKIITFETDDEKYNLFVKYCAVSKKFTKGGSDYTRWQIGFTDTELQKLGTYRIFGRKNLVVIVCTEEGIKNPEVAVLELKTALKCLGNDTVNQQHFINLIIKKGSPYFQCYGTALDRENAVQLIRNLDKHF